VLFNGFDAAGKQGLWVTDGGHAWDRRQRSSPRRTQSVWPHGLQSPWGAIQRFRRRRQARALGNRRNHGGHAW